MKRPVQADQVSTESVSTAADVDMNLPDVDYIAPIHQLAR